MGKSILKSIVKEMANDTTRREFIDKMHEETGIDKASIEEAYDAGKIPAESKANVFTLIEKNKWVNPDIKDSRRTRQNPVAKHARTYSNSGGVHAGKDKTYSRKVKHRSKYEEVNPAVVKKVDDRRDNLQARKLAANLKAGGKTYQYAYKRANELRDEGKMGSARVWAKAAFRLTRDARRSRKVPEEVEKVPPNLSKESKLRNLARHNEFEIFRGGQGEVIFSKNNLAFMWSENTGKIYQRFKRKWNEFGSFDRSSSAEEIWQAIEDNVSMRNRPKAIGERGDPKEHQGMWQIWDYRKKQWVGKPSPNKNRLRNRVDKLDNAYGAYSYQVKKAP